MKKTNKNITLTPEQYIRQKARTLPLGQCYMNKNWFISGIATAVVCRCHKMGTYTFAVFQFDTFCSGLIDCKVEFSRDQESYNNIMAYLKESFKIEPVTYQEVHNLIYGALAFGEDAGFTPAPSYNLAKFILEEDTEDIPLINYQFGRFGKHFLLADSIQELDEFMPHLIAHLGKENILFGIEGSDRYFKGEDFYDAETRMVMQQIASKIRLQQQVPLEEYGYVHPAYPSQLQLKHAEVETVLYNPENRLNLSNEQIDQLLALPHDELKADLEQVLLYETGRVCDELPLTDLTTNFADGISKIQSAFIHALILLGEVGDKNSLPVVLETMCQNKSFYDYQLGAIINEAYVPTLYQLGKEQLDKFFEYLQIPGLYTYARYLIFPAVIQIAQREPERRAEVIEWFRKVLKFYADKLDQNLCCDGSLIGLITTDLIRLQAEELLPELKVLFETGKVNEEYCGNYEKVEQSMKQSQAFAIQYQFEVHERYEAIRKGFDQLIASHNNVIAGLVQDKIAEESANTQETAEQLDDTVEQLDDAVEQLDDAVVEIDDTTNQTTNAVAQTDDAIEDAEIIETTADENDTEKVEEADDAVEKAPAKKKAATKKATAKETATKKTTAKETATKKAATKKTATPNDESSVKATKKTKAETKDDAAKPKTTKAKKATVAKDKAAKDKTAKDKTATSESAETEGTVAGSKGATSKPTSRKTTKKATKEVEAE